jgi:hypothetical protein
MTVLPIEPYYDRLQEAWTALAVQEEFWEWIKIEYGGYQVYVKNNPSATGEKDACGLAFGTAEEATLFVLKWT